MNAICVDDEINMTNYAVSLLSNISGIDEVRGFTRAGDAIDYVRQRPVDIAFLDIDIPDMNGIMLAGYLKQMCPKLHVVFVTAYNQYAVEAFSVRAGGYVLKPFDQSDLEKEVEYALKGYVPHAASRIAVRTFGNFDVFVNGSAMAFKRARAKELLAYLVDRQGAGISRQEAFAALWEDTQYTLSMQKQLDVIIRSLRETLDEYGVSDIFEMKSRQLRIRPELIDCDLYRFLKGDVEAVNAYRGEYMAQYSWATMTEALLQRDR